MKTNITFSSATRKKWFRQGFSLIQLSVLLTVASLTMVAVLPSFHNALNSNSATTERLQSILKQLRIYETVNGSLPCPADASLPTTGSGSANYGVAAANGGATGNCVGSTPQANLYDSTNHVAIGMLPVKTLGLTNDYAVDNYGRYITYAVDTNATGCSNSGGSGFTGNSLTGQIAVQDNGILNHSIAALISHGSNGHGAWIPLTKTTGSGVQLNAGSTDTDEHLVNAHGILGSGFPANHASINSSVTSAEGQVVTFVKKPPTSTFDDIVAYSNSAFNINQTPADILGAPIITPPANGTYVTGQTLIFTMKFPAVVTVVSSPIQPVLLPVTIGTHTVYIPYISGSGTDTLTFRYTVQQSDFASNGISLATPLNLNISGNSISVGGGSNCFIFSNSPDMSKIFINYVMVIADSGNTRMEVFDLSGNYLTKWPNYNGTAFIGNNQIGKDANNNIWVADYNANVVMQFNLAGTGLQRFGPAGCAVGADNAGNVWQSDCSANTVKKYNGTGTYLNTQCTAAGGFNIVSNLKTDTANNIWVSDSLNSRIVECNSAGGFITQVTTGLSNPHELAFDIVGKMWVTDQTSNRVDLCTLSGSWSCVTKLTTGSFGSFNSPGSIAIDATGNVWIVDNGNNRVLEFDSNGNYMKQIGCPSGACSASSANGAFNTVRSIAITR